MRFRLRHEMFERFPAACVGLVVAYGVGNTRRSEAIERLWQEAQENVRARLTPDALKDTPPIAVWRTAFQDLGFSPGRFKSSVEALAARVVKGDALPRLSPAVDLANAVSLRYLAPLGAHDLAQLRGDIEVGPLPVAMQFTPLGAHEEETVEAGEWVYADAAGVCTRRWVWRQCDRTKVTGASSAIVFPIDGFVGLNDDAVRAAQADLARYLQEELGARPHTYFLSREQPDVLLADDTLPEGVVAGPNGFQMAGMGYLERRAAPATADLEVEVRPSPAAAVHPTPPIRREIDAIDELLARSTAEVVVRQQLEERLRRGERLRVKFGIDPTGPQVHLGHAVQFRKLRAFQQAGHTICLVIGDFTAQIGDASDKAAQRRMLTEEEVYQNLATYKKQIGKILDVDRVEWSYNNDWLGPLRFKDVIGLAANFTVAQMLERENFSLRFEAGKPIGLQEFMYPLMQGYDSVALKADVEIGGTEQLFNLMAGRTLQQAYGQRPQAVMTLKLLLGTDGQKMSKTSDNCIFLNDPAKDMYGKLMRIADDQIQPYFEMATEVPMPEIAAMGEAMAAGANPVQYKKRLAYEVTRLYHGAKRADEAAEIFQQVTSRDGMPSDVPEVALASTAARPLPDLLKDLDLVPSKSEARRLAQQHGISIDGEVVTDVTTPVEPRDGMVVRAGKRRFARIRLPS